MSEDGTWQLAPAYDLTYVLDLGGSLPNEDHCLFMRSKLSNFSREDAGHLLMTTAYKDPMQSSGK